MRYEKTTGPRVIWLGGYHYEVVGFPFASPEFTDRRAAAEWLGRQLELQNARHKPRERHCMRCQAPFWSEGIHHRMCNPCRQQGQEPVPASFSYSSVRQGKLA